MKEIFENLIRGGSEWRGENTVCGGGSTLLYTQHLRHHLSGFLEKHQIKSMLDAPCGDYNWMAQTKLPDGLRYIGGDIIEALIKTNQEKYPGIEFRTIDITVDPLPDVDLLFCRDCLIHFSHADIRLVLDNINRSNIKYILMTNYNNNFNKDIKTGKFRELNFTQAPYEFDDPIDSIKDWIDGFPPRSLCLWKKENIVEFLEK